MKRIALHMGVSCVLSLLFANVLGALAAVYISITAGVLFIISLLVKDIRQALTVPIVTGTVMVSCLLFVFVWNNTVLPIQSLDGQRVYCTYQIVDIPQKAGAGYIYTVKVKSVDKENTPQNFKLKVFSDTEIDADYYDNVSSFLHFEKTSDNGFDSYGEYGENIFIGAYSDFNNAEFICRKTESKPVNYNFIKLREKIKINTAYVTDGEEGVLALSFLTGDKSLLSDDVISDFRICAASHIMAVSGLHTALVCYGIYYILKRIGVPLLPNTVFTFALLLSYCAVADFSKSVIRSVVTVSIFIFARILNRKADLLNSLGIAMVLICLNPFAVTDPSAVLTVCAVLGIGFVKPEFEKLHTFKSCFVQYLYDAFTLTASIMITTFPATLIFFKSVSLLGFFLNFILILLAEIVLVSTILFNIFGFSQITAFLPKQIMIIFSGAILDITSFCAEKFSRLFVDVSAAVFGVAVALCLLFCAISILTFKRINIKQLCIFMVLVFALSGVICHIEDESKITAEVTENNAVAVYNDRYLVVIDADEKDDYYFVKETCAVKNFEKAVFIDCDYDNMRIEKLIDCEVQFYSNSEIDVDLGDGIGVKCQGGKTQINVYSDILYVYDDYTIVNGYKAYRNVSEKFSDSKEYVFEFYKNSSISIRREANG
ncbi:MAG: ComEC/Rec2 family competence protein [Eubacterium sp.]